MRAFLKGTAVVLWVENPSFAHYPGITMVEFSGANVCPFPRFESPGAVIISQTSTNT